MTNRPRGTLYIGITSDISRRAWEHKEGLLGGFTRRFGLKMLVHVEEYNRVGEALQRESRLKHRNRTWKLDLIEQHNPDWEDLSLTFL